MPNLFPDNISFEDDGNIIESNNTYFEGSYLFDFEKGEFIKNPDGSIAKCNDLQAYIQWCNKAILTPRYKLAYSYLYGHDFEDLIGSGISKKAIELEIQRMTSEALMVHPRTSEVNNFSFEWSSSKEEVYYSFDVITIDEVNIQLNNNIGVG